MVLVLLVVAWLVLPGIIEDQNNRVLHRPPYWASSRAEALHKKLIVTDLHADSLLWKRNLLRHSSRGHMDVPRLIDGNVAIQAFTVVSTSPRHLNIYRNS